MKRYIIISDVHGCIAELNDLIDKVSPNKEDIFIFNGDLVDKGPDSPSVVKLVRNLSLIYNVVLINGNHDHKHQRYRKHVANGTGIENAMKNHKELSHITKSLSKDDIAFMDTAKLYHKIEEYNVMVVHAGVPPSIKELPSNEDIAKLSNKKRKHYEQMLRVRYVNPKGYMVMFGAEKPEDIFWADTYDGRFGHIFFGHQPFYDEHPKKFPHADGIDLGCCFGNKLCAVVLTYKGIEYITTNAYAKYAKKMGEK